MSIPARTPGLLRRIALIALLSPALAHASAMLPAGHESQVLAWLAPLAENAPVNPADPPAAQWVLADIQLQPHAVHLGLRGPNAAVAHVDLVHVSAATVGEVAGDVRVTCAPALPPSVCAAVVAALRLPGPQAPWQLVADAPREELQRKPDESQTVLARHVLLVVWLVLATLLAVWLARAKGQLMWPVVVVTLAGLGVRLWLSPRTLLHEFHHTRESLGFLDGPSIFANGEAVPALVQGARQLWPLAEPEEVLFHTNLMLSVLTVPALAWLVRSLGGARRHALMAAVLLAALPVHVRWSACEEFWPGGLLLTVVALASVVHAVTTVDKRAWLVAALALALGMQTRPELLMLPGLAGTLLLATPPLRRGLWQALRTPWPWLAGVVMAALCWHVPADLALRGGAADTLHWEPRLIWFRHFLQDQALLGWGLAGLVVLGAGVGLRRAPGLVLWSVGLALGLSVLLLAFYDSPGPNAERQQLLALVLLLVPAAWAVDALRPWLPPRVALVGVLLVPVTELAIARPWITHTGTQQAEFAFLREMMPLLPDGASVLAPPVPMLDALPTRWAERAHKVLHVVDVTLHQSQGMWPADDHDLYYFQGMYCWFAWPAQTQPPPAIQPACQAVRDTYVLEPVLERHLTQTPSLPMMHAPMPPGGYVVGLYRVHRK